MTVHHVPLIPRGILGRIPAFVRVLLLTILFGLVPTPFSTAPVRAEAGVSSIDKKSDGALFGPGTTQAEAKFLQLQGSMKSFAVVILLIMLVVAAIMAAFQKTGMAISIVIAAIILFGGVYVLKLLQTPLAGH